MQNIDMKTKGSILTITVDLSKEQGPSASGKTTIIGSTQGNVTVDGHPGVQVGVNVYRKK